MHVVHEVVYEDGTVRRIWLGGVVAASNPLMLRAAGVTVRVPCGGGDLTFIPKHCIWISIYNCKQL